MSQPRYSLNEPKKIANSVTTKDTKDTKVNHEP